MATATHGRNLLAVLLVVCLFNAEAQPVIMTAVTYTTDTTTNFPNPDRGFYQHAETRASSYSLLSVSTLQSYRTSGITLILRLLYLDSFVSSNISAGCLTSLGTDFARLRQAGVRALLRFAYTNTDPSGGGPYGDATVQQTTYHVAQLKPVLHANADVISVVQFGFIGTWGEWYYTDHWGYPTVTAGDWANRRALAAAILDAVPASRQVQIRTPGYKQQVTQTNSALTPSVAYQNNARGRLAHHNDCFLASSTDFGTYLNTATEYPYLGNETRFLAMGGETCAVNAPRSQCTTAQQELALFHWSYINQGYEPNVLASWTSGGCMATIQLSLGYRLRLVSGSFPDRAGSGGSIGMSLVVRNVGYAAPFNLRETRLVLRSTNGNTNASVVLTCPNCDSRFWLPGADITLSINQPLPILPLGAYAMYLHLADPHLPQRPEFSIRLANTGIWNAANGTHTLQWTVQLVDPSTIPSSSTGSQRLSGAARLTVSTGLLMLLGCAAVIGTKRAWRS